MHEALTRRDGVQLAAVSGPDIQANPDLANPDLANPDLANPDLANPDLQASIPRASRHGAARLARGSRNYLDRLVHAGLGSACLPAVTRTWLMRRLGFRVARNACIWDRCWFLSRDVDIGARVFINVGFFFDGGDRLVIGDNVRIGQFVRVITASHRIGPPTQRCTIEAVTAPVAIEAGCWIGAGVTILPGVTIRHGCVVGAGSLVTRTTEPDGLYAGTPARRLRDLPA